MSYRYEHESLRIKVNVTVKAIAYEKITPCRGYLFLTAQRDCRKTLYVKNGLKNLPQQAEKQPNNCQIVVRNPKNRPFSAILSHFSKIIFERGLIRQFQRFALLVGGWDVLHQRKPEICANLD